MTFWQQWGRISGVGEQLARAELQLCPPSTQSPPYPVTSPSLTIALWLLLLFCKDKSILSYCLYPRP